VGVVVSESEVMSQHLVQGLRKTKENLFQESKLCAYFYREQSNTMDSSDDHSTALMFIQRHIICSHQLRDDVLHHTNQRTKSLYGMTI
jgi:hypothetical protein